MRQKILAGNWKLNGSKSFIESFFKSFSENATKSKDLVFIPPFPYLSYIAKHIGEGVQIGAQDSGVQRTGAFTGEVSADMLVDNGASWVLVGHSERRSLFGDDENIVAGKLAAALEAGLVACLCVGETQEQRTSGDHEKVVVEQLNSALASLAPLSAEKLVIAYEPVWAIGTGLTASPKDAQAMHAVIRSELNRLQAGLGDSVSVLYGGSVNAANAEELFAQEDIDGGLVGGASLKPEEFKKIYKALG